MPASFSSYKLLFGRPVRIQLGQGEIIRACASDVLDNQGMLERFWLGHKAQRLDVSLHVDSAERVTVFPETTFLHINEAYWLLQTLMLT